MNNQAVTVARPGPVEPVHNEVEMAQKLLLIDFENIQQVDLTRLGENFNVTIFVGSSQRSVPIDLVESAQRLGAKLGGRTTRSV
jgi:hypothetical protein